MTDINRPDPTEMQHVRANHPGTPEVAALQADIERTRAQLAATVDQLAAKLDVKARLRPTPAALGVAGAVVGVTVLLVWWRRRSSGRGRR